LLFAKHPKLDFRKNIFEKSNNMFCNPTVCDIIPSYHYIFPKENLGIPKMRGKRMAISYNGLWKLLIDKNKKKTDLIDDIGISSSTLAKMSKGDEVSLSVLTKICNKYGCDYGDLINFVESEENK
jgi:DNA-binding Xre family transcriptional regulator